LLQGLVTIPAIYYAEAHPKEPDVRLLKEGHWSDRDAMVRLVEAIRNSGCIDKAMQEANAAIERALRILSPFPASIERETLESLATYIVNRDF
jgi:geranylgeranyl pyrophosphate synthase